VSVSQWFSIFSNSREQSPSWEANSHSSSHDIPRLIRNPKVHYRVYKSTSMISVLSQMNPIQTFSPCFPEIRPHNAVSNGQYCSNVYGNRSHYRVHKKYLFTTIYQLNLFMWYCNRKHVTKRSQLRVMLWDTCSNVKLFDTAIFEWSGGCDMSARPYFYGNTATDQKPPCPFFAVKLVTPSNGPKGWQGVKKKE
jgi:hypothetical protein